jgi:hypothetical protein
MTQPPDARGARPPSRPWWRVLGHALLFFVGWPAFAYWFGPRVLTSSDMLRGVDTSAVLLGMLWSLLLMWREVLAAAAVLTAVSLLAALLAGGLRRTRAGRGRQLASGLGEAGLTAAALVSGVALELPAALNHPALAFAREWSVTRAWWTLAAAVALAAAALSITRRSAEATARRVAVTAAVATLGFAAARGLPDGASRRPGTGARIVLGLDSLSADDTPGLRQLAAEAGGTWYEKAVTPGLFTNAVWTSIVTSRPVHETGVFFTFQNPDWSRLPESLPVRAKEAGVHTCAFFSDQFTMQLGADLPWSEDHSGPRGWLQAATTSLKDASWFLPIAQAHLPRIPGAFTPANQGGTYSYSLRRELSELLTCGAEHPGALVLGHLDYLHQARYPGMSELDPARRARVRAARVGALVDESIHWQYPKHDGEPVGVYAWKHERLQQVVREAVVASGVLAPVRGNRLVVLSDHGSRVGLTPENFGERRFWHVPLVTFGIAPRDPTQPISLLDVAALLGLPDPTRPDPAPAAVEYATATPEEMKELVKGTKVLPSGRAELSPRILQRAGDRLRRFEPFAASPSYAKAPLVPVLDPGAGAGG